MLNMARCLSSVGNEVTMFALNTLKHYTPPDTLPDEIIRQYHFASAKIDTSISVSAAIRNLFHKGESYNVIRFYSREAEERIRALLLSTKFDVVQLETIFCAPYIPVIRKTCDAKIVLRAHNAEHVIWERLQRSEKNPLKRAYLEFLSRRLKTYERSVLNEIDAVVPITPVDESIFRKMHPGIMQLTVPLGVDFKDYPLQNTSGSALSLFHLGSMDWLPNLEGVKWFLDSCWPMIHSRFPELYFHLAGRGFPDDIRKRIAPMVICEGMIADATEYMRTKQIMIVPLLSGSGMRVKIIQGLAMGKTIISTSIGAEGIDVKDGEEILIADTPAAFLKQIEYCMEDPARCRRIGINGRKKAEKLYSNDLLGKKLSDFYSSL